MLRGHRDLRVYQLSYKLAMEIFDLTRAFPREEIYSLTNQIRRSSRSVAANMAEGFRKRRYPNRFINKLTDCDGEASETQVWIDFALDCAYISKENHERLTAGYQEVPSAFRAAYISCLFDSALSIVTSSTYSISPPTGMPMAIRVTRNPSGFSKRLM